VASRAGWTRSISGTDIRYTRNFAAAANIGSVAQAAVRALVFQPRTNALAPGKTEKTTFTVSVNDGVAPAVANSTTSVVSTSVNDLPTGVAATYTVRNDAVLTVSAANGVLRGARDKDVGQRLSARLYKAPARGTLTLNADGSFRYVPPRGFVGKLSFQYRVFDGLGY